MWKFGFGFQKGSRMVCFGSIHRKKKRTVTLVVKGGDGGVCVEVWFWVSKRVTYGLFWVDSQKKKKNRDPCG